MSTVIGTRGLVYVGGGSKWRGRLSVTVGRKAVARRARSWSSVLDPGREGVNNLNNLNTGNSSLFEDVTDQNGNVINRVRNEAAIWAESQKKIAKIKCPPKFTFLLPKMLTKFSENVECGAVQRIAKDLEKC